MSEKYTDSERRHDFILLFDVTDGNPNGDPDAGNMPRVDPETMQGLVTDVCLKRKVRDYVNTLRGSEPRFKIYVEQGAILNDQHRLAYEAEGLDENVKNKELKEAQTKGRAWMCQNFYDVRMFGAVMSTEVNCGQVRGPVQLTFGRSIDPISPIDMSVTRVAVTNHKDEFTKSGKLKETEMGRKAVVPYGLYLARGFITPKFASDTGVDSGDLALFWEALERMWELDRSASRGMMVCRGIFVFSHEHPLGNAPAHRLFERLTVKRREGVKAARHFSDYEVVLDETELPDGVTLTKLAT